MTFMPWLLLGWVFSSLVSLFRGMIKRMSLCSWDGPQKFSQEGFLLKAALLYRSFVIKKKDLELMFLLTVATAENWLGRLLS